MLMHQEVLDPHHLVRGWAALVPDHHGWRTVPIGCQISDRLVLGRQAGPGQVDLPDVAPRQCGLAVVAGGVKVVDFAGTTRVDGRLLDGQPAVCTAGTVVRLGRVPVVLVQTREGPALSGHGRWLGMGELGSWSPQFASVLAQLALVAEAPFPALLLGETGTGKELAARAVHLASPRRDKPLVTLNCGALHGDLLIAELFGAEKGAYTGSTERRRGAFDRADGGTIFLDEIGELPLVAQAALLRVLEVGEVQVLGGPTRRVDVRVICATHRDLQALVTTGQFRLDLLHRIDVAAVRLPPLRERTVDIAGLLGHFWPGAALAQDVLTLLQAHPWPGNVRELRNFSQWLQVHSHVGTPQLALVKQALAQRAGRIHDPEAQQGLAQPAPVQAATVPPSSGALPRKWTSVGQLVQAGMTAEEAFRHSGLPRATFYRHLRRWRENDCLAQAA